MSQLLDQGFLLDNANTPGVTPRHYELDVFNIPEKPVVYREPFGISPLMSYRLNKLLHSRLRRIKGIIEFTDKDQVDKLLALEPAKIILNGYFQKEHYFKRDEKQVREAFTFAKPFEGRNLEISRQMSDGNAVSVHVRRGDYVNTAAGNAFHGVCSPAYYNAAFGLMNQKTPGCHFFVFSDDVQWCTENMGLGANATYIDQNQGDKSYLDMQLMSACKHHIIANSSFSWWGAWLNPEKNKVVIAPKKWYADDAVSTKGLYPDEWILI